MTENPKICELFKCIQHSQLQDTVKAVKVKFDLEGLTQAANYLAAAVSELPEHQMAHKVSQVGAVRICGGGNNENKGKRDSIHKLVGSVFMGYYCDQKDLSQEDKDKVVAAWKKAMGIPKADEASPYLDQYDLVKNVAVVNGATVWTQKEDNQEFVIIVHIVTKSK